MDWEKGNKHSTQSWSGVWDWLTGYTTFLVSAATTGTGKLSRFPLLK